MNPSCAYGRVSYATWRYQVISRLCADVRGGSGPVLSFLHPHRTPGLHEDKRGFHQSAAARRSNIKDVKRSARYKVVQLELQKPSEDDASTEAAKGDRAPRLKVRPAKGKISEERSPYSDSSISEMNDLIEGLRDMANKAREKAATDEAGIPFEASLALTRRRRNQPESPLERAPRRIQEKKLQIYEVALDMKLENNIWAQILASPSRLDRGTKVRQPRDLMIAWGAIQNPKDRKDYFMPIELSDLEALRRELELEGKSHEEKGQSNEENDGPSHVPEHSQTSPRVQIVSSKLLIQAMTQHLVYTKPSQGTSPPGVKTNSGKLSGALIPYRWRRKQDELQAFHRTRQRFNDALDREPDADEPKISDMAKLDQLQWQPDMPERMEKIMAERVLIALQAVGRDNASGRAVHQRRISVVPVPKDGELYTDGKEKVSISKPSGFVEGPNANDDTAHTNQEDQTAADWMHGAILVHTGNPKFYQTTIEYWHQQHETLHAAGLERLPQKDFLPPTVKINNRFRLPIFNLETLLGREHAARANEILKSNKVFVPSFWARWLDETGASQSSIKLASAVEGSLDAGAEVLSSIVTPASQTGAGLSDTSSNAVPLTSESIEDTEPFLILVKSRAKHAGVLAREIWQLWRYLGGRAGLYWGSDSDGTESDG